MLIIWVPWLTISRFSEMCRQHIHYDEYWQPSVLMQSTITAQALKALWLSTAINLCRRSYFWHVPQPQERTMPTNKKSAECAWLINPAHGTKWKGRELCARRWRKTERTLCVRGKMWFCSRLCVFHLLCIMKRDWLSYSARGIVHSKK